MPSKRKCFVLDTNVLLHDPNCIDNFHENLVVIPITVLDELDTFKKGNKDINRNARLIIKRLDELRVKKGISNKEKYGVKIGKEGKLLIDIEHVPIPPELKNINDNQIIANALKIKEDYGKKFKDFILVSKDINVRVKADSLGLTAEDYENDKIDINKLYSGIVKIPADPKIIKHINETNEIKEEFLEGFTERLFPNVGLVFYDKETFPHEQQTDLEIDQASFFEAKKMADANQLAVGKVIEEIYGDTKTLIPANLFHKKTNFYGIAPYNLYQYFAFELLMVNEIKLVTLVGKAGTGKTLIALAAGLEKVSVEKQFDRLIVMRPIVPVGGKDLGYLPGSLKEKLDPWMAPIYDNLELLTHGRKEIVDELMSDQKLDVEALTYMRGRSLPNQYIIIDEAQNLTAREVKTIITRAGVNTKIVLTGDPYQIDNPYLDTNSNGLTIAAERFKNHSISGHITFAKVERSDLAELASTIL